MKALLISTGRHDLSYLTPLRDAMTGAVLIDLKMGRSCTKFSAAEVAMFTASRASNYIVQHAPDCIVVIGDRAEVLAICTAATVLRVPIAHIHGGEITEGAIDNVCRHAISQLARWNFVAHEHAASVLRYMNVPGEIHVTGSPAIDLMMRKKRTREPGNDIVLAYHPETLSDIPLIKQIQKAAHIALRLLPVGGRIIYTGANPDAGGQIFNEYIESIGDPFVPVYNMDSDEYWDTLAACHCLVGNSSSGVIEAPALWVSWIEIGDRQKGRARCSYGDGRACEKIAAILGGG